MHTHTYTYLYAYIYIYIYIYIYRMKCLMFYSLNLKISAKCVRDVRKKQSLKKNYIRIVSFKSKEKNF